MGSTGAEGGVDTSVLTGAGRALVSLGGAGQARARGDAPDEVAEVTSRTDVEHPLLPPRRLGVGAALDQGFALFRFRFRRLVGLAACLFLPVQLLDLVLRLTASDPTTSQEQASAAPTLLFFGGSSDWALLTVTLQAVALSILGICVGHLVARLLDGGDASFRTLLGVAARRCWVALLLVPLTMAIRLPFLLIPIIGFVLGDAFVFVASIVAGAEAARPIKAIGRNFALTRGAFGPAVVMSLGSLCITQVVRISLYAGPFALVAIFSPPEGLLVAIEQLASLLQLVVQPLTACLAASAYVLLRTRVEGLDLEARRRAREPGALHAEVAGATR